MARVDAARPRIVAVGGGGALPAAHGAVARAEEALGARGTAQRGRPQSAAGVGLEVARGAQRTGRLARGALGKTTTKKSNGKTNFGERRGRSAK